MSILPKEDTEGYRKAARYLVDDCTEHPIGCIETLLSVDAGVVEAGWMRYGDKLSIPTQLLPDGHDNRLGLCYELLNLVQPATVAIAYLFFKYGTHPIMTNIVNSHLRGIMFMDPSICNVLRVGRYDLSLFASKCYAWIWKYHANPTSVINNMNATTSAPWRISVGGPFHTLFLCALRDTQTMIVEATVANILPQKSIIFLPTTTMEMVSADKTLCLLLFIFYYKHLSTPVDHACPGLSILYDLIHRPSVETVVLNQLTTETVLGIT